MLKLRNLIALASMVARLACCGTIVLSRVFQRYVHGEIALDQQIEILLGPRCNNRDAVAFTAVI